MPKSDAALISSALASKLASKMASTPMTSCGGSTKKKKSEDFYLLIQLMSMS
jgi:hypothetical protein